MRMKLRIHGLVILTVLSSMAATAAAPELAGVVLDEDDRPLAGARVTLVSGDTDDENEPARQRVVTDRHGRWQSEIAPGDSREWIAWVEADGYRPHAERLSTGSEPGVIRLIPATDLHVELRDAQDTPIPNAAIELVPLFLDDELEAPLAKLFEHTATTDADGRASWAPVLDGSYLLRVAEAEYPVPVGPVIFDEGRRHYRLHPMNDDTASGGPATLDWESSAQTAGSLRELTVTQAESGEPARDVLFVLRSEDDAPGVSTLLRHSDDGSFALTLPDAGAGHRLFAAHPESLVRPSEMASLRGASVAKPVSLTVPDLVDVAGDVISTVTGDALAAAEIELAPAAAPPVGAAVSRVARADAEGGFSFDDVPQGIYRLHARAAGHYPESRLVTIEYPEERRHRLRLTNAGAVAGEVTGDDDPATQLVQLLPLDGVDRDRHPKLPPDELGQFRFERVRPGAYMLYLLRPDGQLRGRHVEVRPGEVSRVRFDLAADVETAGRVRYAGEIASEAKVGWDFHRGGTGQLYTHATSDEAGRYAVSLADPGRYEVRLERFGDLDLRGQSLLQLEIDDDRAWNLDFFAGQIRGRVVDVDERPLRGADVQLFLVEESGPRYLAAWQTDGDGAFAIGALSPGEYALGVRAKGRGQREIGPLTIGPDAVRDLGKVGLNPEVGLRVAALGPQGQPLERATVLVLPPEDRAGVGLPVMGETGWAGTARIGGLTPGRHTLVAFFPGLAPAIVSDVEASADDREILLQLDAGGTLDVRVYSAEGEPAAGRRVTLVDAGGRDVTSWYAVRADRSGTPFCTGLDGLHRIRHLRPGVYRVSVDGEAATRVMVSRGAVSEASVRLGR